LANLIAAALAYLLLHRAISGSKLRATVTRRLGETRYLRFFAFASVAALLWLGFAFADARSRPENIDLWTVPPFASWLQLGTQLIAFLFIASGLVTPNPGTVRQQEAVNRPDIVQGMLRVTRHPFLWGVAVFAAGHLSVRSDVAGWILFGTLLIVAVSGTASIDAKRRHLLGEQWLAFSSRTSNIPFAAILDGRQRLNFMEIGWRPVLAAAAAWGTSLFAHPYLFGGSVFR
jgi:uncharacterized membrane protein